MSHTDKTRPAWVQVRDVTNRWAMQEKHDHRDGNCTFEVWLKSNTDPWHWRSSCHLDYSYYGINLIKLWPRPPKGHWDRAAPHGRLRAQWRAQRAKLLRAVDPDDVDYAPPKNKDVTRYLW